MHKTKKQKKCKIYAKYMQFMSGSIMCIIMRIMRKGLCILLHSTRSKSLSKMLRIRPDDPIDSD